jgi:hypothetical protein
MGLVRLPRLHVRWGLQAQRRAPAPSSTTLAAQPLENGEADVGGDPADEAEGRDETEGRSGA